MKKFSIKNPQKAVSSQLKSPCNHQCLHCLDPFSSSVNAVVPAFEKKDLLGRIQEAKKQGAQWLYISSGEPTCHPFLRDCIQLIHSSDFKIILRTNAYNLSSGEYAQEILSENIEFIYATLHSSRPHVHDFLTRVQGSYEKTIQGIKNILQYQSPGSFAVTIVATSLNYMMLREMAGQLYGLGVRMIEFCGLVNEGGQLAFPNLLADFSLIRPHLMQAAAFCKARDMAYILRLMPLCILDDFSFRWNHFVRTEKGPGSDCVKVGECKGCSCADLCSGIDKTVLLKYGIPEFLKKR